MTPEQEKQLDDIRYCIEDYFDNAERRGEKYAITDAVFLAEKVEVLAAKLINDQQQEQVICAAIKHPDGTIVPGRRHHDCFRTLQAIPRYEKAVPGVSQGFITSKNRYVDRDEGLRIQHAAGIASADPGGYRGNELYSEDLY